MENKEKKVLLSLKDVDVKFNVRGRILTAIRHVSLDVYENESLAIVGESGSGKSVLTSGQFPKKSRDKMNAEDGLMGQAFPAPGAMQPCSPFSHV